MESTVERMLFIHLKGTCKTVRKSIIIEVLTFISCGMGEKNSREELAVIPVLGDSRLESASRPYL